MNVVKDEEHFRALRELVQGANQSVEIASPYFGVEAVECVLRWLPKGVSLTFTFDWPVSGSSAASIQPAALTRLLDEGHAVKFTCSPDRLHGKVYVADGARALVTSANLTSRGFGGLGVASSLAFNRELGVCSSDREVVADVLAWIEGLSVRTLTRADIEALATWCDTAPHEAPPPPPPPAQRWADQYAVREVLERAKAKNIVKTFEPVTRGFGRAAYRVTVPGVRGYLLLRGRVSEKTTDKQDQVYHFEITPGDQRQPGGTDGYIFVPVDSLRRPVDGVPTVIVPFDRIVGRGRGQLTLKSLADVHGRRINLRVEGGIVRLGLPAAPRAISLDGCCDSTSAFHSYYR